MSEITKLYENTGIEKEVIKGCYEYYAENEGIDIYTVNDCKNKDCNTCKADKSIKEYPPFTAKKQLSLIKWLVCTGEEIRISGHRKGNLYWMSTDVDNKEQESTFEETLAKLINNVWQYLTMEERKQIKEILE